MNMYIFGLSFLFLPISPLHSMTTMMCPFNDLTQDINSCGTKKDVINIVLLVDNDDDAVYYKKNYFDLGNPIIYGQFSGIGSRILCNLGARIIPMTKQQRLIFLELFKLKSDFSNSVTDLSNNDCPVHSILDYRHEIYLTRKKWPVGCEFDKSVYKHLKGRQLLSIESINVIENCDTLIHSQLNQKSFFYLMRHFFENIANQRWSIYDILDATEVANPNDLEYVTFIFDDTYENSMMCERFSLNCPKKMSRFVRFSQSMDVDDLKRIMVTKNDENLESIGNRKLILLDTDWPSAFTYQIQVVVLTSANNMYETVMPVLSELLEDSSVFYMNKQHSELVVKFADGSSSVPLSLLSINDTHLITASHIDISYHYKFITYDTIIFEGSEMKLRERMNEIANQLSVKCKQALSVLANEKISEKVKILFDNTGVLYHLSRAPVQDRSLFFSDLSQSKFQTYYFSINRTNQLFVGDNEYMMLDDIFRSLAFLAHREILSHGKVNSHQRNNTFYLINQYSKAPKVSRTIFMSKYPASMNWNISFTTLFTDTRHPSMSTVKRRPVYQIRIVLSEPFIFRYRPGVDDPKLDPRPKMDKLDREKYEALKAANVHLGYLLEAKRRCPGTGNDQYATHEGDIYYGFLIDIMKHLEKVLEVDFDPCEPADHMFGIYDEVKGEWGGAMKDIIEGKADIIIASLSKTTSRSNVIDFTAQYYDHSGIVLLAGKKQVDNTLFNFIKVFDTTVWMYTGIAILVSGILAWAFEKFSPHAEYKTVNVNNKEETIDMSTTHLSVPQVIEPSNNNGLITQRRFSVISQNTKTQIERLEKENRFTFMESMWSILGSFLLTEGLQYILSPSSLVYMTFFWFFTAIIISTYQANLAARLTVSRLQEEKTLREILVLPNQEFVLEGLQFIRLNFMRCVWSYSDNSIVLEYFYNMHRIEHLFADFWDSHTNKNIDGKSKNTIWEYPVREIYSKLYQNKIRKVHNLTMYFDQLISNRSLGMFIETPYAEYLIRKNCKLAIYGSEFSVKSFGFGVRKGLHFGNDLLLEKLSVKIREMQENRSLSELKRFWWNYNINDDCNPFHMNDDGDKDDMTSSIDIDTVGGTFILLGFGVLLAFLFCLFQLFYMKYIAASYHQWFSVTYIVKSAKEFYQKWKQNRKENLEKPKLRVISVGAKNDNIINAFQSPNHLETYE
ncbi:hypothetical protein SNEBB_009481 [Seison nebaliae]|nr:hypothetical protein SNEBB_009481 [Seison nebaliae]